jgi:hypothetical protein
MVIKFNDKQKTCKSTEDTVIPFGIRDVFNSIGSINGLGLAWAADAAADASPRRIIIFVCYKFFEDLNWIFSLFDLKI